LTSFSGSSIDETPSKGNVSREPGMTRALIDSPIRQNLGPPPGNRRFTPVPLVSGALFPRPF